LYYEKVVLSIRRIKDFFAKDLTKIRAGDKLAVISWEKDGKVCCLSLIKAEDFAEMVKNLLGPLMEEIMAR